MSLAEKRLFLLDMDGTIYLSETLFDGTKDFLRYVREIGGRYLFLTNNSSRGTDAYIAKMAITTFLFWQKIGRITRKFSLLPWF